LFVLKRLGIFAATLLLASVVVFTVLAVLPGDPAQVAAGTQATPRQVAALRAEYGLDGSVPQRYVRWLDDLVTGDLGTTFVSKRSIAAEIGTRLQVTLPLVQAAILTRYVRSAVLEVMREDYIRTARAKGLSRAAALRRHGLRNAAIPVVTVLGLQLTALLVGAVVIENVFTLPGLGKQL